MLLPGAAWCLRAHAPSVQEDAHVGDHHPRRFSHSLETVSSSGPASGLSKLWFSFFNFFLFWHAVFLLITTGIPIFYQDRDTSYTSLSTALALSLLNLHKSLLHRVRDPLGNTEYVALLKIFSALGENCTYSRFGYLYNAHIFFSFRTRNKIQILKLAKSLHKRKCLSTVWLQVGGWATREDG